MQNSVKIRHKEDRKDKKAKKYDKATLPIKLREFNLCDGLRQIEEEFPDGLELYLGHVGEFFWNNFLKGAADCKIYQLVDLGLVYDICEIYDYKQECKDAIDLHGLIDENGKETHASKIYYRYQTKVSQLLKMAGLTPESRRKLERKYVKLQLEAGADLEDFRAEENELKDVFSGPNTLNSQLKAV